MVSFLKSSKILKFLSDLNRFFKLFLKFFLYIFPLKIFHHKHVYSIKNEKNQIPQLQTAVARRKNSNQNHSEKYQQTACTMPIACLSLREEARQKF